MTARELMDYLMQSNADLDAPLFVETDTHCLLIKTIIEDSRGIYLSSEEQK